LLECDPARIPQATRYLPVIEGNLPDLIDLPQGCIFRERCGQRIGRCLKEPPLLSGGLHRAACHLQLKES